MCFGQSTISPAFEVLDAAALIDPNPPNFKDNQLTGPGFVTSILLNGAAPTVAKGQTLSRLTAMLGNQLHQPVIDKTGLTGKYDFTLEFHVDLRGLGVPPGGTNVPDASFDSGPDLATAVQQQLGLRLMPAKAKLDVLVIDKVEKTPIEN